MKRPFDSESTASLGTLTAQPSPAAAEPRVSLLLYHRDGSQMVPLSDGQAVVVGRARPSDVPVRDHSLSRLHARFEFAGGELWVEDLGSTNGTRINGKRVERARVRPGAEVQLGAVTAALHVLLPAADTPQDLGSHDQLVARLEHELVRARTFGRPVTVLMVRAAERRQAHISRWGPMVRQLLRPVDGVALYDQGSILIVLPETELAQARQLAETILGRRQKGDPQLLIGLADFPGSGSSTDELLEAVRVAAHQATGRRPVQLAGGAGEEPAEGKPVVASPRMSQIYETARRVAEAEIPVLIVGETGSGKEVLARVLHERSGRRRKPLRCINCASIPEQLVESALFGHEKGAFTSADQRAVGLFEEASGGTVLLDEIGELSPPAQAALLRVIETKRFCRVGGTRELEVDVRILAATHRDLERMCQEELFRWDLFYRLSTMVIAIPPLRERPEEILPLATSFMKAASKTNRCRVTRIDPAAAALLQAHDWPGNVRELRNVIDRAVVIAQDAVIVADDLPQRLRGPGPGRSGPDAPPLVAGATGEVDIKDKLRRYEAQLLLEALGQHDWNQTRTAEALGMPLRTLVHKMKTYGLRKSYGQE